MDDPFDGSAKRDHSVGDEDWSQRAEADDIHPLPSSLRIEAHSEASRPSSSVNTGGDGDWSQQTDTDRMHRMTSSLIVEDDIDDMDASRNPSINESSSDAIGTLPRVDILDRETTPSTGLAPQRAEPTLKEKLVERERQRRAETERARLKRQFALSSNGGGVADDDGIGVAEGGALRENGSVAGTIGEGSSVALVDIEEEEDQKLTYPMKRFLQEQGNIIEEEPAPRESPRDAKQGVVMERFLKEPVLVDASNEVVPSTEERPNVDRSVSFDMEPSSPTAVSGETPQVQSGGLPSDIPMTSAQLPFAPSEGEFLNTLVDVRTSVAASVADASLTCLPPGEEDGVGDLEEESNASALDELEVHTPSLEAQPVPPESPSVDQSTSSDQPRFFRLTEAEIQEMAAIDEASRSNAPPSDRDSISDSSFVGELVSDFGGHGVDNAGTLSQGTPTTAMESASIASGNHSARQMSEDIDDRNSIDELANGSISSHAVVSSTGGNVSVTANPPSDIGGDEGAPSLLPDDEIPHGLDQDHVPLSAASLSVDTRVPGVSEIVLPTVPQANSEDSEALDMQLPDDDCKITNRVIRPGMVNVDRSEIPSVLAPSTPIRRSLSAPHNMNFEVDGFDFDKNAPLSPGTSPFGAIRETGIDDMWSPGSRMSASPFTSEKFRNYGTATTDVAAKQEIYNSNHTTLLRPRVIYNGETEPLMPEIPKEIVASPPRFPEPQNAGDAVDRAFRDLRSETTPEVINARREDAKMYHESSILQRALSGRAFMLFVTFLVEIPVLLIIVGGSDRLCGLIGRWKFQLLIAFIPLCSAISGNVGLQSSDLTTEAISHGYISRDTYKPWLAKELGASACLGCGMGICLGLAAMVIAKFDIPFGLTIMIAQFISIVMAGFTGTIAPMLSTFFFKRDSIKWKGPLETAIQDVVGCFAMVILSYKVLLLFSPYDVDASDQCTS